MHGIRIDRYPNAMTNGKLRRSNGAETSQVWMFLGTALVGLVGGLLLCAAFIVVFAAAGQEAFAQHFHALRLQTVMLLLIGAGLAGVSLQPSLVRGSPRVAGQCW